MQKINLDAFRPYIISRLKQGVSNGEKIFSEIQSQGFENSYSTFYRYLKNDLSAFWKKQYKKNYHFSSLKSTINLNKYKRAITVETEPGQQAQVDWGHFGEIVLNGKKERLYCFVFVLSYSRASYIEFTTSQKLPVFEKCHINAFKKMGIPQEIVYDNAKTVVLSNEKLPDGTRRIHINLSFLDFANYYGFDTIISPPYWPRNKGKVEAHIKYIRNNFMQGLKKPKNSISLEEFNLQAQNWIEKIANDRIHSNTQEKPIDRWLKEKTYLKFPNKLPDYQTSPFVARFSTKDQFIQYKQNFYSVPKEYAWKKLFIREINDQGQKLLTIYYQDQLIAQHNLCTERNKSIENPCHFQILAANKKSAGKIVKSKHWKNYPEIQVRPFEFYDQLINRI